MTEFCLPDLCDAHPDVVRVLDPGFYNYGARGIFAGPICTLKCHEDNSLVAELLNQPGEGRVLVVDGGGSLRCALLGDNLAMKGSVNGWAGVVIHGAVRDVDELRTIDLGIRALGVNPLRSIKRDVGEQNLPLQFAGVYMLPDQYLYADANGILVAPVELPV